MKIARMASPVHALGPGERVCLWVQGCTKNCPGCISPELQPTDGRETDEALLAQILIRTAQSGGCGGLTISGGDPFEQPEALLRLLRLVRAAFSDILVYTGFTLTQLQHGSEAAAQCLALIDVLIDGPYLQARNRPDCVLRGSDNQIIHYLNPAAAAAYGPYLAQGRILESFCHDGSIFVTGIPNRREEP